MAFPAAATGLPGSFLGLEERYRIAAGLTPLKPDEHSAPQRPRSANKVRGVTLKYTPGAIMFLE